MDINQIYNELDALKYTEIEGYLFDKISEAKSKELFEIQVPLLNEMIGFLRDTTQFDKGKTYKKELLDTLVYYNQQGTMNYATSLLNIANFDRAAGLYDESVNEYRKCEDIYRSLLPEGDYLWAGLYNNESLLYQMMGDNLAAIGALSNALRIVEKIPERIIEVATTYTNIAQSLAALGQMEEAEENVKAALEIFARTDNQDYHYSAAAAVMGIIAYNKGEFAEAASYYNDAAIMVKKVMGENDNYRLLISNRDAILAMLPSNNNNVTDEIPKELFEDEFDNKNGLAICRSFFLKYGKIVIEEKFAEYRDKIAVGLFGEGSECLGFDDELSRDHDWGPGFMLLVTRRVYGEIGQELEKEYNSLPVEYMGYKRNVTKEAVGRTGVIILEDYLYKYLGNILVCDNNLIHIDRTRLEQVPEYILKNMINGAIWLDGEGIITNIRDEIAQYYEDDAWKRLLGLELMRMGQSGQYNLDRCIKRKDRVTAEIYLGEYYKSTLKTVYLLNKKYAPYEKWLLTGASELEHYAEITDCLRAISDMDIEDSNLLMTVEIIAQIVLSALKDMGLVDKNEENWYLEKIGKEIC